MNTTKYLHPLSRLLLLLAVSRAGAQSTALPPKLVPPTEQEVVSMSPFEVISDTKGYFSANTMSGTRFNTKLEDLGSSLTVVTKEQMADFAMLDINDIFLYTAGTEGIGTYTDYSVDRNGSVFENVSSDPARANRVRGIGPANISLGGMESMGRVPVDPLGLDSVEISRGPNANIIGLGGAGGTVNMVPASANLSRNRAQVAVRGDSYGGYRASLDVNRVLLKDQLSVRVTEMYQYDGFVRKPSGTGTQRYQGMVKFQPWQRTTLSASYLNFRQWGTRPTAAPPRDSISFWLASGQPTWDPVTQVVHVNGRTLGPFTSTTGLPDYFNNSFDGATSSVIFVDQSKVAFWGMPQTTVNIPPLFSPTGNSTRTSGTIRYMSPSPASGSAAGRITAQPLFSTTPSVSSKAMYDWSKINLSAMNSFSDENEVSNVQLDQVFFSTPLHSLVGQVAWLRENGNRFQRNITGQGYIGQNGQLLIDVNERLLDGSPNPFFLRPYIGVNQPVTYTQPSRWDTYRAQLAYRLDLTKERSVLKWLGWHQITGYDEYKYRVKRQYGYKDVMADSHEWLPVGVPRVNQDTASNGVRPYFRYYVGDNQGANVDYAPTSFSNGSYPFLWGGQNGVFNSESVLLGRLPSNLSGQTGGSNNTLTILKTLGGVIQSHFLHDSLVTTFGLREDQQYLKTGVTPQLLADAMTLDYVATNHWLPDYRFNSGKTKTAGAVARPFKDLPMVVRQAEAGAGFSRLLASTLRGLAFTYNKSDSFTPTTPRVDLYQRPLPPPAGEGKDYGLWLNMFEGKLVVRYNRYETLSKNSTAGDSGTMAQRVARLDATQDAPFRLNTQATAWVTATNPTWTTAQVQAEVARQIGLSPEVQAGLDANFTRLSATQTLTAKGTELEINVNPNRYWTVAASGTETRSITNNVAITTEQWIATRMPTWTSIIDQRTGQRWWTTNYGGSQTAAENYAVRIQSPFSITRQQEGKANPQIRRYAFKFSTNLQLAAISEQALIKRFSVGGALRWEDKGAIGYYGKQTLPDVITELDANRPIYDKARAYIDAFVSYRTRMMGGRIPVTLRLNGRNLQEGGRLQPIGAYPDGTPNAYRIVDPRQYILSATFEL
jgi:outer membrane receptor protein involved in Fe transport